MYYICYEHPERGCVYETINGEDAVRDYVYRLALSLDLDPNKDIHVFRAKDKL